VTTHLIHETFYEADDQQKLLCCISEI